MANTSTSMTTNLYSDMVLKGFVDYMVPLRAFSLDASPAPAEKGQVVYVPFIPSGSTAASWAESTGYAAQTNTRTNKAVTLSNHYYVFSGLTDIEAANSSQMNLEQMAYNQGASLATSVLTNVFTYFTGSNFSNTTNIVSSSLMTVDKLVDVRAAVSALKWPVADRNIILNSTAFKYLLKDDDLKYIYKGDTNAVNTGTIKNIFGWNNIFENNLLPSVNGALELVGAAVTSNALLVGMRYLQPQPGHTNIAAYPITDPASGITIGYRRFYDTNYGRMVDIYEAVWGTAVGNDTGAYLLTANVDV